MRLMEKSALVICLTVVLILSSGPLSAEECEELNTNVGVDLVSRYVWRGIDFGNVPSIQPSLSFSGWGFELGTWGAYAFSNNASGTDEIDTWLSYCYEFENGMAVHGIVTDYYFPNATWETGPRAGERIKWGNFNDHDATITDTIPDYGAHTFEVGLSITGPEEFPVTVSGYINVYNDAGNNSYFQADFPLTLGDTELDFFVGITPGSKDNPFYYDTDDFKAINIGVKASREIKITGDFSLPVFVSLIGNPSAEISYLVFGLSM